MISSLAVLPATTSPITLAPPLGGVAAVVVAAVLFALAALVLRELRQPLGLPRLRRAETA